MNDFILQLECDMAMKRVMSKVDEMINDYYSDYHLQDVIRFAKEYHIYPLCSFRGFNLKWQ